MSNYNNGIDIHGTKRPRLSIVNRDLQNQNGIFIPNTAIYVNSGSIENVSGDTTGSTSFLFDAYGVKLKRIEVFHSGASDSFNVALQSRSPNTGSNFDPREIIVEYNAIQGSDNYHCGIDRIEDIIALTDQNSKLYLNVIPKGSVGSSNYFKYLVFFESVMIYINKDRTFA
jgi:hypothetical protein